MLTSVTSSRPRLCNDAIPSLQAIRDQSLAVAGLGDIAEVDSDAEENPTRSEHGQDQRRRSKDGGSGDKAQLHQDPGNDQRPTNSQIPVEGWDQGRTNQSTQCARAAYDPNLQRRQAQLADLVEQARADEGHHEEVERGGHAHQETENGMTELKPEARSQLAARAAGDSSWGGPF